MIMARFLVFSLAPRLKDGDHNNSRQGKDLKEDAHEHQGPIGEIERIVENM